MTSPLDYLNADGADEADYEQPMREVYAYRDGERWTDGIVTGTKRGEDGRALVQFDGRVWVGADDVRDSDHYIAVLLNPDSTVYAEVLARLIDGAPADPIRDVSVTDGASNVGTEWRPLDEERRGTRVRYRYTGTAELEPVDAEG
ncbi:hypothetical protein [uncultured Leifsonia sp.]|uniref:hypothetical protein n=1 Tax=Leifsonia sp. TaxID=1870902 RepID=UPI0028D418C7|nr:hypothetical protein [uncultured Leifsonia sp.]